MAKKEYYKENGSYCTKIYLGRDSNGKPKYKKLKAKTTTELRKKEKLFREELSINRGKSYIAFNYANQATFE